VVRAGSSRMVPVGRNGLSPAVRDRLLGSKRTDGMAMSELQGRPDSGSVRLRMVSGAILAGGRSRRFGQDKAFALLGGRPLIAHVCGALRIVCSEVFVVADGPERFEGLGVAVVSDLVKGAGSLGGLYTALIHGRHDMCFVVGCDMPFLCPGLLERMSRLAAGTDAVVPVVRGDLQPLHALYTRRCLPRIERRILEGDFRITGVFSKRSTLRLEEKDWKDLDPAGASFFRVNTPEALERARQIWEGNGQARFWEENPSLQG